MRLFTILLVLFTIAWKAPAQQQLPVIKTTTTKVDIRIGDDKLLKNGWTLDPKLKPDVYSFSSEWPYRSEKICFITDVDSISFNVEPGKTYDFIILLNGQTPCYTQIKALDGPVFMNRKILLPVFAAFAIILTAWYYNRRKIGTKALLQFGYAATMLFWLMTFISGAIHGNYNHIKNVVSGLGAIGTASEVFTSSALFIVSLASIFFSIGFYQASKMKGLAILPALSSFATPVTMIWAAIFPLGNELHSATGPLPLLPVIGSLWAYVWWKKEKQYSAVRKLSLISGCIMLLVFVRFIESLNDNLEGLVQRTFYVGWTVWTIGITYYFSKRDGKTA